LRQTRLSIRQFRRIKAAGSTLLPTLAFESEVHVISDARTHVRCLLSLVTFSFCLVLCTESQAQSGQWLLGVKTETVDAREHTFGDQVGGPAVRQPPPFYVLRIADVLKDSAADKEGLKKGDMIVAINDRRVTQPDDLPRIVRGSNGVLKIRLKDPTAETGFKEKTIDLRAVGALAAGEIFIPHIGIYYQKVPYQDGTFGARLTRDAVPGSPATQLRLASATPLYRLEKGDTIFELDGQRFRTEDDVKNHRADTTMRFIDTKTGKTMDVALKLP
jgi:S1-C subfamily serine protease